ncbi:MAG: ribosome-recycling factor [Patescibacteria group bacterium]|nr:ribosome-recycling factor [Patescibacteria group bacterium]
MPLQQTLDNAKAELETLVSVFRAELLKIRASNLSPALVEDIKAGCFDQELPLKQLGAIGTVSAREIIIQLWDKSYVEGVISAIEKAGMGLSVRVDANNVYLTAPSLTAESRQSLIQLLNKKKEEFFQVLRHHRDKAWKEIQDGFAKGEIREDDKFKGRDKLDETTKEFREKMEGMAENKEKEIKG